MVANRCDIFDCVPCVALSIPRSTGTVHLFPLRARRRRSLFVTRNLGHNELVIRVQFTNGQYTTIFS